MHSMTTSDPRRVLVTGASSGIGAATARRLAADGWSVVAAARRQDRLAELAAQHPGRIEACVLDVTSDASVAALVSHLAATGGLAAVVNNAGGALGLDPVATADITDWLQMYEVNVIGALRLTQALLPMLRAAAAQGAGSTGVADIVYITSTAAYDVYEGGAGYVAAKQAERTLATTLRWEIAGEPIRVIQIAPGLVATEEFSLVRFGGDAERAASVYAGVDHPLVAADIADAIAWTLSLPSHVVINELVIRPLAQASTWKTFRTNA
jgi:NADP-dependent 3-hydroxy acid dehydrogenase YdfG